ESPLQRPDAAQRRPVEVRVDGHRDPLPDEHELEDGDVPAEVAAPEDARAEERTAERAERAAGARVGEACDREPVDPLEGAHGGDRPRSGDRVDRAVVETLRAERDLEAGGLRIAAGGERSGRRRGGDRESCEQDANAHGPGPTRRARRILARFTDRLPAGELRRALLGEGGEALLRVLAREEVA